MNTPLGQDRASSPEVKVEEGEPPPASHGIAGAGAEPSRTHPAAVREAQERLDAQLAAEMAMMDEDDMDGDYEDAATFDTPHTHGAGGEGAGGSATVDTSLPVPSTLPQPAPSTRHTAADGDRGAESAVGVVLADIAVDMSGGMGPPPSAPAATTAAAQAPSGRQASTAHASAVGTTAHGAATDVTGAPSATTAADLAVAVAAALDGSRDAAPDGAAHAVGAGAAAVPGAAGTTATGDKASLASLDQDSLRCVLGFLEAEDLARAGAVNHAVRDTATDARLWKHLFWLDFEPNPAEKALLRHVNPRSAYAERRQLFTARVLDAHRLKREDDEHRKRRRAQYCLFVALRLWHVGVGVLCPCLLLFVASLLLPRRMDGRLEGWTYVRTLWPLWVLYGIALVSMALSLYAQRRAHADERSIWHQQWSRERSLSKLMIYVVSHGRWWSPLHGAVFCLLLFGIPVCVALRVDTVIPEEVPWSVVLLPVWLLFCCLPCFWPTLRGSVDIQWTFMTGLGVFGLPTLIVVALGAVSLEGVDVPLYMALIPFWIIDGCAVLIMLAGCCRMTHAELHTGRHWEVLCGFFVLLLLAAPVIVFEVLLSMASAGEMPDTPWASVFSPLSIFIGYGVGASIVLCINNWRAALQREGRDAW